ncbi:MAG: glycine--tRNA ligase subunit beta [Candidatus Syntrophosphaera sp.]|nr:glycine--tRNA ligase subunit beta [Candidatus Syntrophosphaera sp.]
MRDFLLEIGVEEMPATHLGPAMDFIRDSFAKLMQISALECASSQASSTPRRLFLLARSVQEKQADIQVSKTGPAKRIAYDEAGNLLPAALGFLKKNSAKPEDLYIQSSEKGEFIALSYVQPGRESAEILKEWIGELIPRIPFPKTMVWNDPRLAFSRPLRWLCALWGEQVIPVRIAGMDSGNFTFGNRYKGLGKKLAIPSPGSYLAILKENAVLADRTDRHAVLTGELDNLLRGTDLRVVPDARLADTVTDLVEYPSAVLAEFDPEFLKLPEKIITSTISQNQKYFAVQTPEGSLSNKFVFVSNGNREHAALIRKGNEKVVAARLADALWYYQEDTGRPLESYLPRLSEVVFQSKLGTMADKSARIGKIAGFLCQELNLGTEATQLALRTALLCKADLVTTMLGEKEFTKLQGYIGKQYALASGEPEEVAEGIYEHYLPRGTNDGLPQTLAGAIVALADKLDSVCGIVGIGLLPTGSTDPFALRRAANGVVQIIVDRGWGLDFSALLRHALTLVKAQTPLFPSAETDVQNFFRQRVEWLLKQLQIDYDVIDSVMHLSLGDLPDLRHRALALQDYRTREDFQRLVIGFKRVSNIIGGVESFAPISLAKLEIREERELHDSLLKLQQSIGQSLETSDYSAAIDLLVGFGKHIDRFFDAVLVNCEDPGLRDNRYALLNLIKTEFLRVADISRIVLENETSGE